MKQPKCGGSLVYQVIAYRLKGNTTRAQESKAVLINNRPLTSYTLIITTCHMAFFKLVS